MFKRIKRKVFEVIRPAERMRTPGKVFALLFMGLIVLSVVMAFVVTFDPPPSVLAVIRKLQTATFLIFSVEYLLRLWTADYFFPRLSPWKARYKYAGSPLLVIDLLAISPFYLPFLPVNLLCLRAIRLLRLLHVFRMNSYTDAITAVNDVFKRKARQLAAAFFMVSILMVIASILIYDAEHGAQPEKFRNAFSGVWWAVTTLTTVGYGDIYPVTAMGKVIATVIAFLGIGIVAIPAGILSAGFIERFNKADSDNDDEVKYCPNCGKKLK
jgi:voltage-gated potassium channel